MLLIAVLLFGSVIGFNLFKQQKIAEYMANRPEPEFPVTVTEVKAVDWVPVIEAIGFIEPNQGVTVANETSGVIDKIAFESGTQVEAGQPLVLLDSEVEKANLKSSQAKLPAAEAKYKRYQGLFKKGSISKEAYDEAEANYYSLKADIESLKATIDRREIKAPFAGVVGIRNVYLGQYIQAGSDIVRLEDSSVMRLRFTVPQTDISRIKLDQEVDIFVDAYPDQPFKGSISAIEPAVNVQSGLIQVQADIPNSDGKLRSGMFARANIIMPKLANQVTLPQTAITFTLYGDNVYIVTEEDGEKRVKQHVVKVGERTKDIAHILEGVKPGDVVVTSGQVRLSNHAIKEGESPFRAAIIGTREIAVPVIAMTLTLGAVYAPIALMGGITGSLFKEFALTLAGSVFVSGIIALTLSPMMCSKMLKANEKPSKFEQKVHHILDGMTTRYEGILRSVMANRPVVIVFAIIVFASLPILFKFIPSELAPSEDKGVVVLMGTAPSNANLDYIQNTMNDVNKILSDQPEVEYAQVFNGVPNSNQAFGLATLKPWSEREASQSEITKRVGGLVASVPGMSITAFQMPELPGAGSGLPIQFVITTPNSFESLFTIASDVLTDVASSPMFVYSDLDLNYDSATMKIKIDKDKAGAYGVTMQDIGITLSTMMADGYVNRIDLNGRSYEVIPQVERKWRLNPESMKNYYVRSVDGKAVPLGSLITIDVVAEPRSLPHFNQLNSATVGAVPSPGVAMGDAINWFEDVAQNKLPAGYNHDYMGEARQFVTEGSALYATFGLALAIIFLVLAIQFESLRDPIVIMVSVPLAVCGALIALAWGTASMNIYSQVGLITLVGLITKHGILICEVAKEEQLHNKLSRIDAVMEAAKVRLRPILMTTAAMIAGLIPLMYATGAGAAQRFSIGIVIVAGLAIGTLFTLFVLPVIYSYLAEKHKPLPVFVEDKDLEKLARVDEAKAAHRELAENK